MIVLEYILLIGLIVCAVAAPLCKRLLAAVIVYMAFSLMMAVLWSLLQGRPEPHQLGRDLLRMDVDDLHDHQARLQHLCHQMGKIADQCPDPRRAAAEDPPVISQHPPAEPGEQSRDRQPPQAGVQAHAPGEQQPQQKKQQEHLIAPFAAYKKIGRTS